MFKKIFILLLFFGITSCQSFKVHQNSHLRSTASVKQEKTFCGALRESETKVSTNDIDDMAYELRLDCNSNHIIDQSEQTVFVYFKKNQVSSADLKFVKSEMQRAKAESKKTFVYPMVCFAAEAQIHPCIVNSKPHASSFAVKPNAFTSY